MHADLHKCHNLLVVAEACRPCLTPVPLTPSAGWDIWSRFSFQSSSLHPCLHFLSQFLICFTSPISPAPASLSLQTSVLFGVEGRVSERAAPEPPSVHPQNSTVSRPLPEAIRSSHKHTPIHSLLFYLLVTLLSAPLFLILPSLPPLPPHPNLHRPSSLINRGFSHPHCFLPRLFFYSLLYFLFPPSLYPLFFCGGHAVFMVPAAAAAAAASVNRHYRHMPI